MSLVSRLLAVFDSTDPRRPRPALEGSRHGPVRMMHDSTPLLPRPVMPPSPPSREPLERAARGAVVLAPPPIQVTYIGEPRRPSAIVAQSMRAGMEARVRHGWCSDPKPPVLTVGPADHHSVHLVIDDPTRPLDPDVWRQVKGVRRRDRGGGGVNNTITLTGLDLLLIVGVLTAVAAFAGVVALAVISWAPEAWILRLCRLLQIPVVDLDHVDADHRPFIDQAARFGLVTNTEQERP